MTRLCIAGLIALSSIACIAAGETAGVALTYKMAKGQALTYECVTTGEGTISAPGRNGPVSMNSQFTYEVRCTEVDEKGNMTMVHTVRDLSASATWNGQPLPVQVNVPVITTVTAPNGRVLKTQVQRSPAQVGAEGTDVLGALGGGMGSQFDTAQLFGELRSPGFPVKAVVPGDRWKQSMSLKSESGQPLEVSYVTSFLDYARLNDRECARLQSDYELPLDLGLMGDSKLFNMSGKQTGSQVVYFDYGAGHAMRFDGTGDTRMTMGVPQLFGGAGGEQVSVSMNLRTVTTAALKPQAAADDD